MRAALLHGPGDLRIEQVPDPVGEVVVDVRAATACGTDVKMLHHGHPALGRYPARLGHETAGVRRDSGERVLVGDSVPCRACPPCRAGRTNLCRAMTWVLGGFAEAIAAPEAALHAVPDGLPFAAAAMAEPLAACVHAVGRGTPEHEVVVLGGGTIGLMLARLLVLDGREVRVIDRHPERRAQADDLGAIGVASAQDGAAALVFEAVGRPEAWRTALMLSATGGTVVMVGGCPADDVPLSAARVHYEEIDVLGAFHHTPGEVDEALLLLSNGAVDHAAFAGPVVGLDGLAAALEAPTGGEARKIVVDPTR
jgi:L-iditol 2-dehydrogenase